jgi:Skp family chaperone for outer membrane proteins
MRKVLSGLFVLLAISVISINAQELKIGVVDADQVIQNSAKGKAFFTEYNNFVQAKQKEIKNLVTQFQNYEKVIQARAAAMSGDDRRQADLDLEKIRTDLIRKQEDAQRETQKKLNSKLDQFQKELGPLIRQIALEKRLDVVFNYGPNSNIVFISDRINITAEVIRKYDQQ